MEQRFTTAAASEARNSGSAAAVTRAIPITFTSSTRAHSASSLSSTVPTALIPALLTRMSRPPSWSLMVWMAAAIVSRLVTSQTMPSIPSGSSFGAMSSTATRAPRSARSFAVARPMPDAPPVTAATSPVNSAMSDSLRLYEFLAGTTKLIDLELDDVARAQIGMFRQPKHDTGRRYGVDEVTGAEHHELAQVPDHMINPEDHARRRAVLTLRSVHPETQAEVLRIHDLIGRHEAGAERLKVSQLLPLSHWPPRSIWNSRSETSCERTKPAMCPVSYTHLRAHETGRNLVCRLLLEKK